MMRLTGERESDGAHPDDAEPGVAEPGGAEPGGADPGSTEPGGAEPGGAEPGGAEPGRVEPGGAEPGGAEPGGAEPGPRLLKHLKNDPKLVVLKADKGNATVVTNQIGYNNKMVDILSDKAYRKLARIPTHKSELKTNLAIRESNIDPERAKYLTSTTTRSPRIYGLPKIHKTDVPLRPIFIAIGSPTQALAAYLAKGLRDILPQAPSYVKNSFHFIEILKDLKLDA